MKKTVGSSDKIIRIVLAVVIGYFAYTTGFETAWVKTLLYVISAILFITAFTGVCPMYSLFKINTCKVK